MNNEVTQMLGAMQQGGAAAADQLMPLIYAELKQLARARMAGELPGQTLQATALVHEAWMRLVDDDGRARFNNRAHFFGAAAEAMRRILVDAARRKLAKRRGGRQEHLDADEIEIAAPSDDETVLAVHEALEKLAAQSPERAELVKMRFFAGFSIEEAAVALGISERTAKRWWTFSRAWLHAEMSSEN